MSDKKEDYVQFGDEWKKEIMKLPKGQVIEILLAPTLKDNQRLTSSVIQLREAINKLKVVYLVDDLSKVTPEDQFELWDEVLEALKETA